MYELELTQVHRNMTGNLFLSGKNLFFEQKWWLTNISFQIPVIYIFRTPTIAEVYEKWNGVTKRMVKMFSKAPATDLAKLQAILGPDDKNIPG